MCISCVMIIIVYVLSSRDQGCSDEHGWTVFISPKPVAVPLSYLLVFKRPSPVIPPHTARSSSRDVMIHVCPDGTCLCCSLHNHQPSSQGHAGAMQLAHSNPLALDDAERAIHHPLHPWEVKRLADERERRVVARDAQGRGLQRVEAPVRQRRNNLSPKPRGQRRLVAHDDPAFDKRR